MFFPVVLSSCAGFLSWLHRASNPTLTSCPVLIWVSNPGVLSSLHSCRLWWLPILASSRPPILALTWLPISASSWPSPPTSYPKIISWPDLSFWSWSSIFTLLGPSMLATYFGFILTFSPNFVPKHPILASSGRPVLASYLHFTRAFVSPQFHHSGRDLSYCNYSCESQLSLYSGSFCVRTLSKMGPNDLRVTLRRHCAS